MNKDIQIIKIPSFASGEQLTSYLTRRKVYLSSPCGGRGVCGKCRVKVKSGYFVSRVNGEILKPDSEGCILSCRALCSDVDSEIEIPNFSGEGLTIADEYVESTDEHDKAECDGVALDIGTTTIAAARVDKKSGRILRSVSCLNPQQMYGADVISRIEAAKKGQLADMRICVLDAVRTLLEQLCVTAEAPAEELVVAGNTTMLHLFCGVSPEGMGTYPFTPVFTDVKKMSGSELGLPVRNVTLMPSVSAFIGGDITAGMLVCGLGSSECPALLLDIGTNGEMVFDTGKQFGNRLIAASAAAGPALEGANLSCGIGGVDGAVSRVADENGKLVYRTIGDKPAKGICGCGVIDLCSVLLNNESIDETGYLEDDPYVLKGMHRTETITNAEKTTDVYLNQKDIREIQLAKSALRAGIDALLDCAGMNVDSFVKYGGRVYIAGGLGYYISPINAARVGLLPQSFVADENTVSVIGNSALSGAVKILVDSSELSHVCELAKVCTTVELNKSQKFNDGFIEYMMFPDG